MTEDTRLGEPPPSASGADIRTFLFADMRGYTRFTQEQGDRAASELAGRFADLVREVVPGFEGELLELRGDEALSVFRSARQALSAAGEIQRRLRTATDEQPAFPLGVGMGLDAGEAIPTHGGYRGASLNLAARLCAVAKPGEILCTAEVAHLARRVDGVEFVPRKPLRLKGVADPVRAVEVVPQPALPPPPAAPPAPKRRPRFAIAGGVAVAVVGLAVVVALVLLDNSNTVTTVPTGISLPHNSIAAINPKTDKVLAHKHAVLTEVYGIPFSMAGGYGSVWTYGPRSQDLYRMDASSYVLQQVGIGISPTDIATSGGYVWLIDGTKGYLMRIAAHDPNDVPPQRRLRWGVSPGANLAASRSALWVSLAGEIRQVSVLKVNPATGKAAPQTRIHAGAIAADGPYVWITQGYGVKELQPNRSQRVPIQNPGNPPATYLAAGFGDAWYAVDLNVWKISPAVPGVPSGIVRQIPLPTSASAIAIGGGRVWVATYSEIDGINPNTDSIVKRIPLATPVSSLAFYDGKLWAART